MKHIQLFENYKETRILQIVSKEIIMIFLENIQNINYSDDMTINSSVSIKQNKYRMLDLIDDNIDENNKMWDFFSYTGFTNLVVLFTNNRDVSDDAFYEYAKNTITVYLEDDYSFLINKKAEYIKKYFIDKLLSNVVHELTHVYDYFVSKKLSFKHSKDIKIKKRIKKLSEMDYNDEVKKEFFENYYNLSYEVKSHLNELILDISNNIENLKTFENIIDFCKTKSLKKSFYNGLNILNKKYVTKILYKLFI